MEKEFVLVSDFDGTISFDDFFFYVKEKFFSEKMLQPWYDYLEEKITHFEALFQMFSQIRVPKKEFDDFIKTINIDVMFEPTLRLCSDKKIPVFICSAGCDYYIKILLGDLIKKYSITLITNSANYNTNNGLIMKKLPSGNLYFDENVGISKSAVVSEIKLQGKMVIFAGDGPPDFEPAKIADIVFAKKILLEKCLNARIVFQKFEDYQDIFNYIKEL